MRLIKAVVIAGFTIAGMSQLVLAGVDPLGATGLSDPRASAMGGSGAALPGSASSGTINPANLVFINWPELSAGFAHQDLGDEQGWYLNAAMPLIPRLVTQFHALSLSNPRLTQSLQNNYELALGFPLSPNGQLLAGITGKFVQTVLPQVEGMPAGGGVDLGMLLTLWRGENENVLRLGVVMQDAQSIVKLDGKGYTLPMVFRYGLSWQLAQAWMATVELDTQNSQLPGLDSFSVVRMGLEHTLALPSTKGLAARLGYFQRAGQSGVLTAGLGLGFLDWHLDYAFQCPTSFYNSRHELALTWAYGRPGHGLPTVLKESEKASPEDHHAKEKIDEDQRSFFSALDSAADATDDFLEYSSPKTSDYQADQASDQESTDATQTSTYSLPVPEGPAGQEHADLVVDPEMPASFSGYFSNSGQQFSIAHEDVRLHAVINPFSPNNDGKRDKTIFVGRLVNDRLRVSSWRLYILRGSEVVRLYKGGSGLPRNLEWDGKDEKGRRLPDGEYSAILRVLDKNGLELAAATEMLEIRTKSKPVDMEGPGKVTLGGPRGKQALNFTIPKVLGSSEWRFMIYNPADKRVFERNGNSSMPEKVVWKPNLSSRPPAAGTYRAVLRYRDDVGLRTRTETTFVINYAELKTDLTASASTFKPVSEGGQGLTFSFNLKGTAKIKNWKMIILDQDSKAQVRALGGQGEVPGTIAWDGMDQNGKPVPGGHRFLARLLVLTTMGAKSATDSQVVQSDLAAYGGGKALAMNLVRVLFQKDQSQLTEQAKSALKSAAATVTKYNMEYQLQITGHCDSREGKDQAMELSRLRAQHVADYLIRQEKIPANYIQVAGKGIDQLMVTSGNDQQRAKNRRAEVLLLAK